MKAIIWKELRENLKWAALGFAVISVVLTIMAIDVKQVGRKARKSVARQTRRL